MHGHAKSRLFWFLRHEYRKQLMAPRHSFRSMVRPLLHALLDDLIRTAPYTRQWR